MLDIETIKLFCSRFTPDNCNNILSLINIYIKPYWYYYICWSILLFLVVKFRRYCFIFVNKLVFYLRKFRKDYILKYEFVNYANNNEAVVFSRKFEQELLKIADQHSKNVIIYKDKGVITNEKKKIILLKWCINEQLFSDDDKINKWEFSISFLWWDVEVEGYIREKKSLSDITDLNSGLINFIRTLFISLAAFNNDYDLAKNIVNNCDSRLKPILYYYIYYHQLINPKVSYEDKLNIFDLLVENNVRKPWDGIEIIYSKVLYKTWNIERAERIVDWMKGRDSNNPVWYINKAFLELAKWNEKLWFEEYEKMHRKFSITQLNRVNIKEVIDDIDMERRKWLNSCFDLGIIYLSYYYVPEIFNSSIAKSYLLNVQSKPVKKWLQKILEEYEEKYFK